MFSGSQVLLYLRLEDKWTIVGGLRSTKFNLSNQIIDNNIAFDSKWRNLIAEAGIKYLTITGAGAFTNSNAENEIQKFAFSGKIAEYKLVFPAGNQLKGSFLVSSYQRVANISDEETYSITLTSSGEIFFLSSV